jgi:hypothetical protein
VGKTKPPVAFCGFRVYNQQLRSSVCRFPPYYPARCTSRWPTEGAGVKGTSGATHRVGNPPPQLLQEGDGLKCLNGSDVFEVRCHPCQSRWYFQSRLQDAPSVESGLFREIVIKVIQVQYLVCTVMALFRGITGFLVF